MDKKGLLEALAKLEHEQWVEWSRNIADTEVLSLKRLRRWDRLWCNYNVLSEKQKDSDRAYARKVIRLLKENYIISELKEGRVYGGKSACFVRSNVKKLEIELGFEDSRVMVMDLKTAIQLRMLLSKKILKLERIKEVNKDGLV